MAVQGGRGGALGSDVKRERPHPVQSMKTVNYKDCWGQGGGCKPNVLGELAGWRE